MSDPVSLLRERYGEVPPVVYFVQRREDGPVKIGHAVRIAERLQAFAGASPEPVILRAMVPGGKPLEHWFHRRHAEWRSPGNWYAPAEGVVADARVFAMRHLVCFEYFRREITAASLQALRELDPVMADVERLYRNGTSKQAIAEMAGMTAGGVRVLVDQMRRLGFDMAYRNMYAPRGRAVA